jgi:hypothetical protein
MMKFTKLPYKLCRNISEDLGICLIQIINYSHSHCYFAIVFVAASYSATAYGGSNASYSSQIKNSSQSLPHQQKQSAQQSQQNLQSRPKSQQRPRLPPPSKVSQIAAVTIQESNILAFSQLDPRLCG